MFFARACAYLLDALVQIAAEALSSKLVACHCEFGGGYGRGMDCVVSEATTCEDWYGTGPEVKVEGERRQCCWIAPLCRDRAASFSLRSLALKRAPCEWIIELKTQGRIFIVAHHDGRLAFCLGAFLEHTVRFARKLTSPRFPRLELACFSAPHHVRRRCRP